MTPKRCREAVLLVLSCLVLSLTQSHAKQINDSYVSNGRRLYRHLLDRYEKSVRPVRNESEAVQLRLNLGILAIEDLDEANQAFYATVSLGVDWTDVQLIWDPKAFGDIPSIRIHPSDIWTPDLVVYNSLTVDMGNPGRNTLAFVYHDGSVYWISLVSLRTFCPVDLSQFPFDEHICMVKIGSWTYDGNQVNPIIDSTTIHKSESEITTGEWLMTNATAVRNTVYYPCCSESYPDITISFTMKRISTFATHLFLAPSITLSLIIPAVFILPPTSSHKMTMGGAVLLGHVLLLGEFIKYVPSEHPNVPLIARFFLANIVLVSISLAISAVVVSMWSRGQSRVTGPPAWLRAVFLNDIFTRLVCVNFDDYDDVSKNDRTKDDTEHPGSSEVMSDLAACSADDRARIVESPSDSSAKSEWIRLAIVFDRLFFILYLLVVIAISLGYIGYL